MALTNGFFRRKLSEITTNMGETALVEIDQKSTEKKGES